MPTDTDGDGDGFSACGAADCNDGDPDINPDATEVCNDVDDDCDGAVDEAGALGAPTWWADSDGDDYGNPSASVASCERPPGYADNAEDCNDSNATIGSSGDWWEDTDGDGVEDGDGTERAYPLDNCVTVPNPAQRNTDRMLAAATPPEEREGMQTSPSEVKLHP